MYIIHIHTVAPIARRVKQDFCFKAKAQKQLSYFMPKFWKPLKIVQQCLKLQLTEWKYYPRSPTWDIQFLIRNAKSNPKYTHANPTLHIAQHFQIQAYRISYCTINHNIHNISMNLFKLRIPISNYLKQRKPRTSICISKVSIYSFPFTIYIR